MFKEYLINKLRLKRQQLTNYQSNNNIHENKKTESNLKITITTKNNIIKMEISDYISIDDYIKKLKAINKSYILDLISNNVLWNSKKQKVNKGIYYVISIDNHFYNILFTERKIQINEQIKKENIIEERLLTINTNTNEYNFYSAKHDNTGNTYYTKYYNKNKEISLGMLDLSENEAYKEISLMLCNLEVANEINSILDLELLKINILEGLNNNMQIKR